LEALAETSERIAAGDLTVRAKTSGIPEIGRVAETHNAMVDTLGDMLERERHFTANPISCVRRLPVSSWASRRLKNRQPKTPDSTSGQRCRRRTIGPRS
jgi:HAMP domain